MPKMVYKPVGITPYELIQKLKIKYPNYKKVAFTGRLDPMAHGEMLLLITKNVKNYHNIYHFIKHTNIQFCLGLLQILMIF